MSNDHNLAPFVFDFLLLTFDFTFAARPGGEIGRRTVFRWQHPKGCAGSNPVPGTENRAKFLRFFVYMLFGKIICSNYQRGYGIGEKNKSSSDLLSKQMNCMGSVKINKCVITHRDK